MNSANKPKTQSLNLICKYDILFKRHTKTFLLLCGPLRTMSSGVKPDEFFVFGSAPCCKGILQSQLKEHECKFCSSYESSYLDSINLKEDIFKDRMQQCHNCSHVQKWYVTWSYNL